MMNNDDDDDDNDNNVYDDDDHSHFIHVSMCVCVFKNIIIIYV